MAGINIFVSSTCYDLSQVRKDLCDFIISLGYNPILSEQKDFPIDPQLDNWENCINAVKMYADVFVLIIGSKYGSVKDTGKSITNTEYLTAIQKGIPIYTFALKEMTTLLSIWERNPATDFSDVVDNNKVFEFLADVRKRSGLWNFEFETAQDIMETLRKQLSILFQSTLKLRKKIVSSPYEDLYSRISSKALNIIMQKKEGYDAMFFMQVMNDGIKEYSDLKNDYNYSIILRPINERRNFYDFMNWLEDKINQMKSYIISLQRLSKTFPKFYKENDDESDLYGLYYVASTYAEFYANFLKWGISIKGMVVPDECKKMMKVLSDMPSSIIKEMEKYPVEAMEKIPLCVEKNNMGKLEKKDMILFPFDIDIPEGIISAYKEELDKIQSLIEERKRGDFEKKME